MPTAIACPKCKKKYSLPDTMLGKPIKCPACKTMFKVGVQAAAAATPAKKPNSTATSKIDPAEFASFGLGGPVVSEPELFGDPLPSQAGNPLANHVVSDPGFADTGFVDEDEVVDPAAMFQNPATAPARSSKSAGRKKAHRGDPKFSYGSLSILAILIAVGLGIFFSTFFGILGYASYQLSKMPAAAAKAAEAAEAAEENGEEIEFSDEAQADIMSIALKMLGLMSLFVVSSLFLAAMVMVFMYRANCNVRALGATGLQISPGGSVGWWFCPILNFWKPVASMTEIYKASVKPEGGSWKKIPDPNSVGLWWMCYILCGLPSKIGDWIGGADTIGTTGEMILFVIGMIMFVVAGGLLIKIVFSISSMQDKHATSRGLV